MKKIAVYLEKGQKKVFAGAIEWPGWCRVGRDEEEALRALFEAGPRYAKVMKAGRIEFSAPDDVAAFEVVERVEGNATTEFGAPDIAPQADSEPVDEDELKRLQGILKACWKALDAAAEEAEGKELRKGPRGGGRELEGVLEHVHGAEASYLSKIGGKGVRKGSLREMLEGTREAVLATMPLVVRGEVPAQGPRGGSRWSLRYFVRREAWHVLDHVWEIEDRAGG